MYTCRTDERIHLGGVKSRPTDRSFPAGRLSVETVASTVGDDLRDRDADTDAAVTKDRIQNSVTDWVGCVRQRGKQTGLEQHTQMRVADADFNGSRKRLIVRKPYQLSTRAADVNQRDSENKKCERCRPSVRGQPQSTTCHRAHKRQI